jgi:flagellar FliJ protein
MKRFKFRLERLLALRSRLEREQAKALGHAIQVETAQRQVREEAAERWGQCESELAGATGPVASAGMLRNLDLTLRAAAQDLDAAETSHHQAEDRVRDEQERFGEARKDRRVVERLRERRHGEWERKSERWEQGELDGIARNRWLSGGNR